ncbi:MAG: transglycosylase SLT domain-containing protein [Armatimonadetes bacterium]|nr:transglycosylase SLT domain-containing protein [Armatimonadota bacterium]
MDLGVGSPLQPISGASDLSLAALPTLGAAFGLASLNRLEGLPRLDLAQQDLDAQQLSTMLALLLYRLMASRAGSLEPARALAEASGGATGATGPAGGGGSSPRVSISGEAPLGGASGELKADSSGKVKPDQLRAYLEKRIASSKLNGFRPEDGARYGVDGSARSWADFMTKLVQQESGFNSKDVSEPDAFRGGSRGLFQLSFDDAKTYGLNGGKPFTAEQLADPAFNADVAVTIMERLVLKTGSISSGAGQYWGPIKRGWTG